MVLSIYSQTSDYSAVHCSLEPICPKFVVVVVMALHDHSDHCLYHRSMSTSRRSGAPTVVGLHHLHWCHKITDTKRRSCLERLLRRLNLNCCPLEPWSHCHHHYCWWEWACHFGHCYHYHHSHADCGGDGGKMVMLHWTKHSTWQICMLDSDNLWLPPRLLLMSIRTYCWTLSNEDSISTWRCFWSSPILFGTLRPDQRTRTAENGECRKYPTSWDWTSSVATDGTRWTGMNSGVDGWVATMRIWPTWGFACSYRTTIWSGKTREIGYSMLLFWLSLNGWTETNRNSLWLSNEDRSSLAGN